MINFEIPHDKKSYEEHTIATHLKTIISDNVAMKIINGVSVVHDGKHLINKKSINTFLTHLGNKLFQIAKNERKNKGGGWECRAKDGTYILQQAIEYFDDDTIHGELYDENGELYKKAPDAPKNIVRTVQPPTITRKSEPPKPQQFTLFNFLEERKEIPTDKPTEEKIEEPVEELDENNDGAFETPVPEEIDDDDDGEPTELEVDKETGEILSIIPFKINKPNSIYERYLDVEKQYPHAVVAYRLGDFYEIFGDNAIVIAKELELTLTGRDCGLAERVPMVGFPYHASDSYFRKIRTRHKLVILEDGEMQVLEKLSFEQEKPKSVLSPPPVLKEPELAPILEDEDDDDLKELREQTKHIDKDAFCILLELFNYELDIQ